MRLFGGRTLFTFHEDDRFICLLRRQMVSSSIKKFELLLYSSRVMVSEGVLAGRRGILFVFGLFLMGGHYGNYDF